MKSIRQILIITIIIFNIISLCNCKIIKNEYSCSVCLKNKIVKVSPSNLFNKNNIEDLLKLRSAEVQQKYEMLKNKSNLNVHDIKQNGYSKNNNDILTSILTGIQKTIQKFNYNSKEDIPLYFDDSPKIVDIDLAIKKTIFRAFLPESFLSLRVLYNTAQEFNESFMTSSLIEIKNTRTRKLKLFYTSDYKYFVQTITKNKQEFFSSMLFEYFSHFCKFPKTLLPKYSGLYYLKQESIEYYIVVVRIFYPFQIKKFIDSQYFLNGSDRSSIEYDKKENLKHKLLDNDFILNYPNGLKMQSHEQTKLVENLENDTKFLAKFKIIDYNFVLIIFDNKVNVEPEYAKIISNPNQYNTPIVIKNNNKEMSIYYGIIDILHIYTFAKEIKHTFKCLVRDTVRNPNEYQQRFMTFITRKVFMSDQNV